MLETARTVSYSNKSSHEMHRRSQAIPAEGISKPLESPVTYTESNNVIVVIIQ